LKVNILDTLIIFMFNLKSENTNIFTIQYVDM